MNNANIAELEARGYKYIIGAKIKNESQEVKDWIQEQPKQGGLYTNHADDKASENS